VGGEGGEGETVVGTGGGRRDGPLMDGGFSSSSTLYEFRFQNNDLFSALLTVTEARAVRNSRPPSRRNPGLATGSTFG